MSEPVPPALSAADAEKRRAALSSVAAAVVLTGLKLGVGLATNSLGILSEAAHSGLDLVAALVTYFAVRLCAAPPDKRHPYGHGKVENLAALAETALLLLTCVWILHEAFVRLFIAPEAVEVTVWSFAVIGVSIAVDVSRSRMLKRVAEKHQSQALEADALHFSTDVWSSLVVLLGLGAVVAAGYAPEGSPARWWLTRADALAAVLVAGVVVWVSLRLGRRAVDVLLDGGSEEVAEAVEQSVSKVPGVTGVVSLRLRQSGPAAFVDMSLNVVPSLSAAAAHEVADAAEEAARAVVPGADITVHVEPGGAAPPDLPARVRDLAAKMGLGAHGVVAHHVRDAVHLEAHLEVPMDLDLAAAHELANAFEARTRAEIPDLASLVTHIEPVGREIREQSGLGEDLDKVRALIQGLPARVPGIGDCHNIEARQGASGISVSFHCRMDPLTPVTVAHETSANLERMLRAAVSSLWRVVIHIEPQRPEP